MRRDLARLNWRRGRSAPMQCGWAKPKVPKSGVARKRMASLGRCAEVRAGTFDSRCHDLVDDGLHAVELADFSLCSSRSVRQSGCAPFSGRSPGISQSCAAISNEAEGVPGLSRWTAAVIHCAGVTALPWPPSRDLPSRTEIWLWSKYHHPDRADRGPGSINSFCMGLIL